LHTTLADEYIEACTKQNLIIDFDSENKSLFIRWGLSAYKTSENCGKYIIDLGEDESIIGIEVLGVSV
jgi:Protein of unknown function (DUF2283)